MSFRESVEADDDFPISPCPAVYEVIYVVESGVCFLSWTEVAPASRQKSIQNRVNETTRTN